MRPTPQRSNPQSTAIPTPRDYLRGLGLEELPELLSVNQVMALLGISRQMVHRLIERGELAAVDVGPHTLRVFRASLVDYLTRQVVG